MNVIGRAEALGIIPVVSLPKTEQALPLAESLLAGGLNCAEITFRTDAAAAAIALIRERFPDMLIGAGTVLSIEQVELALDAGAEFIVSPGTNPSVVDYCLKRNVTIFAGVCTPTEIELARSKGLEVLKFFPAEATGGVKMLKALCAPYRQTRFIPTGGIDLSNIRNYLDLPQVVACGGSWMVKSELISEGSFQTITSLARQAMTVIKQHRELRKIKEAN